MLSGGGDSSLSIYDLDQHGSESARVPSHRVLSPMATVPRRTTHKFGVSDVQWYPHDTGMFFTASFDKSVKVWNSNVMKAACTFSFADRVYAIAVSPVATSHSMLAAATSDPNIRLCDLRSGSFAQTLTGHKSHILSVQWSPSSEFLLASGSLDGTVRLWDVRRAKACLMSLDRHNAITTRGRSTSESNLDEGGPLSPSPSPSSSSSPLAHHGGVTSLCFTPDGWRLASAGTDNRIRLWDVWTGCNMLVNYGPEVFNMARRGIRMSMCNHGNLLFHPNGNDILQLDLHDGKTISVLKGHFGLVNSCVYHPVRQELYSCANDQQILAWTSRYAEMAFDERGEVGNDDDGESADEWSDSD
eukprot:TRINITY_DN2321_c0_g1_i1.p1 TRINITY_DN2321_c0_g1~~TRINITY_DN2321_c0_g1_i1.p1  ORF type:complete len:358 (-),score=54.63 TRINITY_DN2321_c0_g1_i1:61-1134(-)